MTPRNRLLPPPGLLLSLVVQLPALWWFWPLNPPPAAVLTGIVMVLAGVALNIWAERLFRRSDVGVCPFSPVPRLVSGGPYRVTRNPMYLGLVLISAGAASITGVYQNLCAAAALAIWLHFRSSCPRSSSSASDLAGSIRTMQVVAQDGFYLSDQLRKNRRQLLRKPVNQLDNQSHRHNLRIVRRL